MSSEAGQRRRLQLREHLQTPLYRNAYALIVNTGLTSALGAVYWIVAARVADDTNEVGHVTALISAMMLLSTITQLNLVSVLIRFLPRAGSQTRRLIINSYLLATGCAVVVTTDVIGLFHVFGSHDSLLNLTGWATVAFVASTAIWSIFSLQDAVLTALRKSVWIPIENALYGAVKIAALFALIPLMGDSDGIFASWNIPTLLAVIPITWLILRRLVPVHAQRTAENEQRLEASKIARFVAGDYTAGLFAQASTTFLPILVISVLDAKAAAYFYIAQIIATTLDRVSLSFSSSLTVEAAGHGSDVNRYARSVLKKGLLLVGAAALFVIVFAPWILHVFGKEYSENATTLLRLLALASVPRVVSMVYGSLARLWHKTYQIAMITFAQALILTGGSVLLMDRVGVEGVGYAAIAAQSVIVIVVLPRLLRATRPGTQHTF